ADASTENWNENCRESCGDQSVILCAARGDRMASSVLVVDDDPNLVRLMSKFLKLEGLAPVPAANGQEALAYLRDGGDASVILLDLRMPVMDGWAFRIEQRRDPVLADIPIVILSGLEMNGIHE